MTPVVAVIAPGMMGAAVGGRLAAHGLKVLTSLTGRSAETVARAKAAGLSAASDEEIAASDFILSILPPGDAVSLAQRFAPALTASNAKPVFVDCNAISPPTAERVAAVVGADRLAVRRCRHHRLAAAAQGGQGPALLRLRRRMRRRFAELKNFGLDVRVLSGPLTAASAMKMSYAGITKGTQALAAVMMLAATRGGSADALFAELKDSQPQMLAYMQRSLAMMPPKAYRWVAEMHEIADFVSEDPAGHELYSGAAHFYEQVARDFAGDKKEVDALLAFLSKDKQIAGRCDLTAARRRGGTAPAIWRPSRRAAPPRPAGRPC